MATEILAFWTPGLLELLVILIISLIVFGIPVLLIVLLVVFLLKNNKERQNLRLKVEKLTDELEQVRKQTKGGEKDKSPAESR